MKLSKFFEFVQSDFEALDSFHLKDDICRDVYDNEDKMFSDIRDKLMIIAQDFYSSTELKADIKDVILVGSLANYNWSKRYSDFDLHIVIDYKEAGDEELITNYTYMAKKLWNFQNDIKIKDFEVEVFIQDESAEVKSTGQYSILNDRWIVEPVKIEFTPDEDNIRMKAETVMSAIDDIEEKQSDLSAFELKEQIKEVWDKIKRYRKSGLESEGGEFSTGNLTFKFLRRNGYIGKVIDLRVRSYEKQFED